MSGWKLLTAVIVALVLVILGYLAVRFLTNAGVFTRLEEMGTEACRPVPAPAGPEDLTIDWETGWVYVSATDRRAVARGEPVRGDVYAMRLDDPSADLIPMTGGFPADFRPHGISLWRAPDGSGKRLFVVNHPANKPVSEIAIFSIREASGQPPRLDFVEAITHTLIREPNDVLAVGERAFYATNDHRNPPGSSARTFEDFLRWNRTDAVYHDGVETRVAADRLTYANGIAMSPDGAEVYIAETTDGTVRIYSRDRASGDLTLTRDVWIGTGPDNIDVHPDGSVWVTAHPKLFDFLSHSRDASALSPTRVVKLTVGQNRVVEKDIYLDLGDQISGGSVAAVHDRRMVIGGVFQPKLVLCDLP